MPQCYIIRAVTAWDEFRSLAFAWTGLLERSEAPAFFLTHEWLYHWARYFLGKDRLWILLAEDERRNLKGIVPLYIRRTRGPFSCREVAFLGSEHVGSVYLDVIAEPRDHRAVVRSVYEYLFRTAGAEWDLLTLQDLPADSQTVDVLQASFDQDGKAWRIAGAGSCPTVRLPSSSQEYRRSLSANTRYNVRRKLKALEGCGRVTYRHVAKVPDVAATFDTFVGLHEKRWRSKGAPGGVFSRPEVRSFHEEVIKVAADKGWLSLTLLMVDQQPVAGIYGFTHGGTYYFYLPGLDGDVAPHASPGMLLLAHRLEQAIAEGHWHVDLLRGDEDYKRSWANGRRRTLTIRTYNRRLPALYRYVLDSLKDSVKIVVR